MTAAPVQRWMLVRGLGREAGHWGEFIEALQGALGPGHAIFAMDLPSNGARHRQASPGSIEAMAQACRQAANERPGSGPWRVAALSMGAMVALEWARLAPHELAGCALINTSLAGTSAPWQRLRPRTALPLAWRLLTSRTPHQREAAVLRATSAQAERHARVLDAWASIAALRPVHPANAWRQVLAAARYRAPAVAPPVPLLLLRSARDRLVSPACSQALAKSWGLPLLTHPQAGHDLPLDDPQWLAAALAGWARGDDTLPIFTVTSVTPTAPTWPA